WNTKYRYRVKAVNDAGSSDYTTVDGSTSWNPLCLSGTPDVPGTFTAKPTISTDRIDLSWTETKAVTLFNLQYALSSQPQDWSDVQLTQDRRTFSLTGLIANTEYSFRVRAANGCADPSGYSTVVKATTLTVGHDQDPIQVVGVDRLGSIKIFAGTTPVTADFVDHFTNDNQHRYSVQAFQADGVTVSKDIGRVIWGVAGSGVAISSISDASPTQATGALVSASSAAQTSGAVSATIVSAADSSIERQAIVSFDVAIPVVVVDPPAETRVLTVEKTGVCSGTITSSVGSIICGTDAACRATIAKDSGVELTEVATAGCVFAGWGGVCSSSGSTPKCSLTLSDNATATARFNAIIPGSLFEVNITKDGDGTGSVTSTPAGIDCGGTCSANLRTGSVTLQETPDADSHFSGWTIAGNNPIDQVTTFALSSTTTAKATFSKNEPSSVKYKLSVFKSGNGDGMITSTSTPAEAGISCGSVCEKEYGSGTKVKLTATSNSHSFFDGWSGGSCSGTAPCTFVLDQAAQITANFHSESIGVVKMYELPPSPSPSRRIDGGMDVFTCAKQVGCTDDADTGAPGNQHAYSVQVFRKPTIADLTPSVVHDISKLIVSSAPSIQAQPAVIAKIISMNEYLIASAISCYKQTNASKRYNCRGTSITPIADQSLEDAIRKFTLNELYINYQGPRPAAFFDQSKITGALSTYSGFEVNPQTVVWSFSGNAGVFAKDAVDDRKGTITASATKNEPGKNTSTLQAVVTGFDEKQSTVSAIISNENCDYPWEYTENTADFRMHYCAGVGTQDLPLLKTSWERTTLEAPFTTEKVFQFTDLSSSTDAIVLRTAPNPTWAKLTDWYLVNVPYGSPSETIINGYPAIRDTFGTYVNALSTSTAGWVPKIYYFTANTNAGATTRSILDSLIIPGLEFSRGEKYSSDGSPASHDFGGLKLRRDMQRIYAMRDLQVLLTKSVPISAGSYLINQTLSAWKSWTSVLANAFEITLPIDPYYGSGVSQFGGPSCGASSNTECTCSGDFDKFTCMKYSTSTSTFNFSNVESSLASAKSHFYTYVYTPAVGNSVASSEVCAKLELGVVAYSGIVGGKLVTSTNPAGLYCVKNP
ncbi:MAG: fibronectin type III domain-containing protein, partial [bacterium]|nr:fibronectin type III domain-containing protein [bacterium]